MRRLPLAATGLLLAVTSACSCEDSLSVLRPRLQVTPEVIDMGRRVVGRSSEAEFLVGNGGTASLSILSYTIEGLTTDERTSLGGDLVDMSGATFSVVGGPATVGAQRSAEGQIAFLPPTRERFGGVLILRSDDLERPVLRVPLVGEGGPPLIAAEPPAVDFEVVNEGPGASRIVRVKNIGFDQLQVSDLRLEGPRAGLEAADVGYSLVESQATTGVIEAGDAWEVEVQLTPTVAAVAASGSAELRATLVVISDAENEPRLEVPLEGEANLAPAAKAVELITRRSEVKVGFGREVVIDGSETEDPEGDPFVFAWSLVEKPSDSNAILTGTSIAGPCDDDDDQCEVSGGFRCVAGTCKQVAWTRVTTDAVGTFRVRLRATDARGAYREADAVILPRDLAVVLVWATAPGTSCTAGEDPASDGCCYDTDSDDCLALPLSERRVYCCGQTDLDVHLLRPGGVPGDFGQCPAGCTGAVENDLCYELSDEHAVTCRQSGSDCGYQNRFPEWFEQGRQDDPRLDADLVRGFGPEVITLDSPADGSYRVFVHYFEDYGRGEDVIATVRVYEQGLLVFETMPTLLNERCQAWLSASLVRTGGPQDGSWAFDAPANLFDDASGATLCDP